MLLVEEHSLSLTLTPNATPSPSPNPHQVSLVEKHSHALETASVASSGNRRMPAYTPAPADADGGWDFDTGPRIKADPYATERSNPRL